MNEEKTMDWKDELKKKWYLHTYNGLNSFTTCQEEVIEFIESLLKQQRDENDLLKSALEYIVRLESKKHLGHPRLTDKNCIFCQAYFAINNGAFGYTVSKEYYNGLSTHQNQKEK